MADMASRRGTFDPAQLRGGMQVYDAAGRLLGSLERFDDASVTVRGHRYEITEIDRIEGDRLHLTGQTGRAAAGTASGSAAGEPMATHETTPAARAAREEVVDHEGEVRVPVVEERLAVEKREAELGEVQVRTRVEEEQQTVPVELEREEVRVRQEEVPARPVAPGETADAFREGTLRVPVRGEEAVAHKAAVVTGEVVVEKARTTETQEVSDTVRRARVDVDQHVAPGTGRRDVAVGHKRIPPRLAVAGAGLALVVLVAAGAALWRRRARTR